MQNQINPEAAKFISNARHEDEPFEDYKVRLQAANKFLKRRLRGVLFYDSSEGIPYTKAPVA